MLEYHINLAGCECAVVEWNPEAKLTAFALHGWLDNLASFQTLASHMPNVRLIAVDFPGHGHSAHLPKGLNYHFIDGLYLIDDLIKYFQQEQNKPLSQVNIIGHSMGGAISCLYAAAQKIKVANLILIDTLGPLTIEPEQSVQLMSNAIQQRADKIQSEKLRLGENKQTQLKPFSAYKDLQVIVDVRAQVSDIDAELIAPIVERSVIEVDDSYTWRSDSRLKSLSPTRLSEAQLLKMLSEIEANVLLIEGHNGYLKKHQQMQSRKAYFNHLTCKIVSGGHHVHLQQPQICAAMIMSFLDS